MLSAGQRQAMAFLFFHHTDNFVYNGISYLWLALVHRRGLHPVLLLDLLAAAQLQGAGEAGAARLDRGRSDLAVLEVHLRRHPSAPRPEGALRAVLRVGRFAVLGVYLGADPVRRSAIQRGAVERHGEVKMIRSDFHFE